MKQSLSIIVLSLFSVNAAQHNLPEGLKDVKILDNDRCTTIAVGKKATIDGSTMCTDTMDCAECDW